MVVLRVFQYSLESGGVSLGHWYRLHKENDEQEERESETAIDNLSIEFIDK